MPQALQSRPSNSLHPRDGNSRSHTARGSAADYPDAPQLDCLSNLTSSATPATSASAAHRAAVSKLTTLLEADPVALADIGEAIRAHADLESLVMRLCGSLALTCGIPVSSVEEAAIVLGKDRLNILVRAWSAMYCPDAPIFGSAQAAAATATASASASASANASHNLARDLLLLMPFAESFVLTPEQRAALQDMLQFCR